MKLKRDLSKFTLLLLAIGSIVGSGWLFGSFYAAQIAGPAAILSWLIGGIFIAIIALSLAELSSMLPIAGGSTAFITLTHGRFAGSIFSWATWIWSMMVAPIETQAVLQYASNYIPNILNDHTHTLSSLGLLCATGLMLLLSFINILGVKIMAEANNFIMYWKLLIPIIIVFVLLSYRPHPSNFTSSGGFLPNGLGSVFSSISGGGIALSYFGFQIAIFLAGEAKNPQTTIPFALFGSLFACTLLYTLLQIGFILSVNPTDIQNGWSAISFSGDAGPFAGIFVAFGLSFMIGILYFDAIISPFGTAIGYVASSSRILYSMALQGDAPTVISKVNRFSIPWVAVCVNFALGMLFFLPFAGWQEMASFISAAIIFTLAVGPLCLPIFRKNYHNLQRPFKLKYASLISFISFYMCNLILHWTGWDTIWKLETILLLGFVLQFAWHYFKHNNLDFEFKTTAWVWIPVYLLLSGIISYFGAYGGGKNVIMVGPDFLVVFVSTVFVYFLAQKSALSAQKSRVLYEKIIKSHANM